MVILLRSGLKNHDYMATYIFFWNPDISSVTKERYMEEFNHGAFLDWSIHEWENVKEGDHFYMVICGTINAIIAKGDIVSDAWESEDWSPKKRKSIYYVELDTWVAVNPFLTDTLLTSDEVNNAIPDFNWYGGHSGRLIDEESAKILDTMYEKYIRSNPQLAQDGAMWDDEWGTGQTE